MSTPDSRFALDLAAHERARILKAARSAATLAPVTITDFRAALSGGGKNDYYSNGDYWWPDPALPGGLPYVRRDGQTNPANFDHHRVALRRLRDAVSAFAAVFLLKQDDTCAAKAADLLRVFFLDPDTRMNPHLRFAQAIPGVCEGRGIGVIDTLHLIEIPVAVSALSASPGFSTGITEGLRRWFADYLQWMITSPGGREEGAEKNNHAVAYWLQVAVFARFTGDEPRLAECRRQFREELIPRQMAHDGSFPAELARTKPYAYSIFQLDNLATLAHVLAKPDEKLWDFEASPGRGLRTATAFLYPHLADKSRWPYPPDVQAWDGWPTRSPALLFAGLAYGEPRYLGLWRRLPADPSDEEVRRNLAITQPLLWVPPS
jgi:hypothetical protein